MPKPTVFHRSGPFAAPQAPRHAAAPWAYGDSTLQSDIYPQMLLEQTLVRRQVRARQARRQRPVRTLLLLSMAVALAGLWLVG